MLYVVGTPIGNLEDSSLRQAKTLAHADVILAEDTRSAQFLLQKICEMFSIPRNAEQKLISYYKEKEFEKLPQIVEWLQEGKNIALISEAGMPGISDPGLLLIKTAIKKEIPFTVIPGPSAFTTALLHSGLNPQNSMFLGFLPKKSSDLRKVLQKTWEVKTIFPEAVFVAFESPNRINQTLAVMSEIIPAAEVCVTRELTKKFEEVLRGSAVELKDKDFKGEITIVFS